MHRNLRDETIHVLGAAGKSPADVLWCGSEEFGWFSWEEFAVAANHEYDSGFGAQEVAKDLLIVGADFWLEREYDGRERWAFKRMPVKPSDHRPLPRLTDVLWDTLKEIEGESDGNQDRS